MKVKDVDALREQIFHDPREAFTKHQVWLLASEHNKTVPTFEAIPKDQYETRLKADMVAILDKIKAEIKALSPKPTAFDVVDGNPVKDAVWETIADVLKIVDKYKAKTELQKSEVEI